MRWTRAEIGAETGRISGAPSGVGASEVTVTITDAAGNASEVQFLLVVTGPSAGR